MLVSVLINNYNYAAFLEETVNSVLAQSYPEIEIIVVDDGSTDNSRQVIEKLARTHPEITAHFKPNGGQLSAFNAGVHLAKGEILFFLDADDLYHRDYIEKAITIYRDQPECDFLYCAFEQFGATDRTIVQSFPDRLTDLGYTGLLTYTRHPWIGEPTSTLSIRRSLAQRFFPIPYEEDWRIRADDCLIWLASLYNGRKFYLKEPLIRYRIHGNNRFFGRRKQTETEYYRDICRARLFTHAAGQTKQYNYLRGYHLFKALLREAATGNKNRVLLSHYRKALKNNEETSLLTRWKYRRRIDGLIKKSTRR